jgi:ABC-type uncharacterized transport system auxiliary subunit
MAVTGVLRRPRSLRMTSLVYQLYRIGWQAIPIVVLITFLIGAIIAQQGFFHFRRFGAESYTVDMIGILVLRELGVLIVAIMVAGRSGSAYTAELGSMKMREEIDALSTLAASLAIPEPTAVAMLQTQRMLFAPSGDNPGFAEFLWADSIPKLVQARLIDSFENYDIAHAPLRTSDLGQADYQLLIDIRRFCIATDGETRVEIGLSARIVDKTGKVVASRLVETSEKLDKVEPATAVAAFDAAFARIAKELIGWTVQAV